MPMKTQQLQIRVTPEQKAKLKLLAKGSGQGVSTYVLSRALPEAQMLFDEIVRSLRDGVDQRFKLAELNDFLSSLSRTQLMGAVCAAPEGLWQLPPLIRNYVTAMVEQVAHQRKAAAPPWVRDVPPLDEPHFATPLKSLRLHLLRAAPVPFKRRNIYVDSAVGDRV